MRFDQSQKATGVATKNARALTQLDPNRQTFANEEVGLVV
jgi:hypothetical protein